MRRIPLLIAAVLAVLLFVSGSTGPQTALAGVDISVGDGDACPNGVPPPTFATIHDALTAANVNDTIFVCQGTYDEPTLILDKSGMSLLGPGSTPADDGEAIITKAEGSASDTVRVTAAAITVAGFTIDAAPPANIGTYAIEAHANSAHITDNVITGAVTRAVEVSGTPVDPDNVEILRNHFADNPGYDLLCFCRHALIQDNVISESGQGYLQVTNVGNTLKDNMLAGTEASIESNGGTIDGNTFDLTGLESFPLTIAGSDLMFSHNLVENSTDVGLGVLQIQGGDTSVTITNNTFQSLASAIVARDGRDDAFGTTMTIGGSAQTANVFRDSGGSSSDFNFLLNMVDVTQNANAEFNDWGYCSASEIEQEIFDGTDQPGIGVVDDDPFISPDPCPTPTATPSPTPTPSPSPTPSPTSSSTASTTPSPTGQAKVQGDGTCDGQVTMDDVIAELSESIGVDPGADCPEEADADCDGDLEGDDALRIERFVAGLPQAPPLDCPQVGDAT